jgi:hypothetical protein
MKTTTVRATHVYKIPLRIAADPAGIAITVHSAEGWARTPTAELRPRGSAKAQHVPLNMVTPFSFAGHVCGLPASMDGTIEVTGATRAGVAASAVEDFSFARTDQAIRFVGPGGQITLHIGPARGERAFCIGPPGLDVLAFPRDAVMIGCAYAITTTEKRFTERVRLAFSLPRGSISANAAKLAICRWKGSWATWDRLSGSVHASEWQMLTAELAVPGVYAVLEHAEPQAWA